MSYYLRFLLRGEGKGRFFLVIFLSAFFSALLCIFLYFLLLLFDSKYHLFFLKDRVSNNIRDYYFPQNQSFFANLIFAFSVGSAFSIPIGLFIETFYKSLYFYKSKQEIRFLLEKLQKKAKKEKKFFEITLNKAEDLISLLVNQNVLKWKLILKFDTEKLNSLEKLRALLLTESSYFSYKIKRNTKSELLYYSLAFENYISIFLCVFSNLEIIYLLLSFFNLSINFLSILVLFIIQILIFYFFSIFYFAFKSSTFFKERNQKIKFLLLTRIEKSLKKVEKFKENDKDIEIIFTPYFFSKIRRRKKLVVNFESENIKT